MLVLTNIQTLFYYKQKMYYFFCPPLLNAHAAPWLTPIPQSLQGISSLPCHQNFGENKTSFSPTIIQTPLTPTTQEEPSHKEPSHMAKFLKNDCPQKKRCQDEDYVPEAETTKSHKKSKQLQNRNVVPNIIRLVLSFVQKPGKSSKIVQHLLNKDGCRIASVKRFFLFHKLVKGKMDNYVNGQTLGELTQVRSEHFEVYSLEEQMCYRKITRKLVLYFLKHQAINCVLTSKRMDQTKKKEHVMAVRSITDRLIITLSN